MDERLKRINMTKEEMREYIKIEMAKLNLPKKGDKNV